MTLGVPSRQGTFKLRRSFESIPESVRRSVSRESLGGVGEHAHSSQSNDGSERRERTGNGRPAPPTYEEAIAEGTFESDDEADADDENDDRQVNKKVPFI